MGLRDIQLKHTYDSSSDDILNDFYIPVLSNSIYYKRLAGFFSSDSLAIAARGISKFLRNKGRMKVITSVKLNRSDVEAIINGIKEPTKIIEEISIRNIEHITDEFVRDHINALAWMVANNMLEIRIALPSLDKNLILNVNKSDIEEYIILNTAIFHQKVGILEDNNGDMISFSGSINETAYGWSYNIEEFKVFRKWIESESRYFNMDNERFERYWTGRSKNVNIYDIPTAVKEKLVKMTEDSYIDTIEEKLQRWERRINDRIDTTDINNKPAFSLRDYQITAIESWFKRGKGFIEMATGTGKTYVALGCLKKLEEKHQYLTTIITVPFKHLIDQWVKNLQEWGYCGVIIANSDEPDWRPRLANSVHDINNRYKDKLIVVTTHNTFSHQHFIDIISKIRVPILLIADEVHGLGSSKRRLGLLELYQYRIGLSATPQRWFDEEGTDVLFSYFGDTVFRFPLGEAIKRGYLTPYYYYPDFIPLSVSEFTDYLKYTKLIARQFARQYMKTDEDNKEREEVLEKLLLKRKQIIINAENKLKRFIEILDTKFRPYDKLRHCIIYCSPQQIDSVQDILNKRGIIQHRFTGEEDNNERQKILEEFASGNYQALVAMKCLDEGVDVPPTEIAFILASSTNPKEFIQRRGRILRLYGNKKYAYIYDLVVIPTFAPDKYNNEILNVERQIIKSELNRIKEFAESSMNPTDTFFQLERICSIYKIDINDEL